MAIGLGAVIGFDFPENFRYPYAARSIKEFWSRWHITLSRWLRDYVFLPLAYRTLDHLKKERYLGVRSEHWSYVGATVLTMSLCGLWHGASWLFLAWGLYHALFMAIEHIGWGRKLKRLWPPLQHTYALLAIVFGWVLFRSPTLSFAGSYYKALCGLGRGGGTIFFPALFIDSEIILAAAVALAGSLALAPLLSSLAGRFLHGLQGGGQNALRFSLAAFRLLYLAGILHAKHPLPGRRHLPAVPVFEVLIHGLAPFARSRSRPAARPPGKLGGRRRHAPVPGLAFPAPRLRAVSPRLRPGPGQRKGGRPEAGP